MPRSKSYELEFTQIRLHYEALWDVSLTPVILWKIALKIYG